MAQEMYRYKIVGYYFAGEKRKYFDEVVMAADNVEAMQLAIGVHAWNESREGNTFKLDVIHYDCLD